jgi:hypothetical protein
MLLVVLAIAGCGDDGAKVLAPTNQDDLLATLDALAAMGEKKAGTPAGQMAAAYIEDKLSALGLTDVHRETFSFPLWELGTKSMTITIDGVAMTPGFDVFEASGGGTVDGPIVDVGTATDAELAGVDLTGKIALVNRNPSFHRSAQLRNVTDKGAAAMLYLSVAPENLRQVGSVRFDWEAADRIPAISIGADDGKLVRDAVLANKVVRAQIAVTITTKPGTGANVIGRIPGERPETIVLGAHYDTWFSGSSDNGSGVAELLAIAGRRMQRGKPKYTLVFVGYDGEEIGLYGGYDYLHKHDVSGDETILAVINFESPSAKDPDIAGLVHSNQPKLDEALQKAHLRQIYGVYAGLEIVAKLFGGIIPTDIQGHYRSGVPTVTTAVTNPYYHTVKDTPDKVDLQLLVESTDAFDEAIGYLLALAPEDLAVVDREVWTAEVTTVPGSMFTVTAKVKNGDGMPAAGATAIATVLYNDFTAAVTQNQTTDATGTATFVLPGDVITLGSGSRFLHVSAGPVYPLAETIVALP